MNQRKRQGDAVKSLLGGNIRLFREAEGYSQEELAEKAEISPPYLGAIERGEKWPGPETLWGIASGLKVNIYDLMKPENTVSRDLNRLAKKMINEIQGSVNRAVRAINVSLKDN